MFEAMATVVGNVVTNPVKRDLANGEQVVTFRMASNSRRYDPAAAQWVDGGTLFLTVTCWRRLVAGVDASVRRGDPVIAHGQLRSLEYRAKDGTERRDLEMRATSVGPDLSRCTAQVVRRTVAGTSSAPHVIAPETGHRTEAGADTIEAGATPGGITSGGVVGDGPGDGTATTSSAGGLVAPQSVDA